MTELSSLYRPLFNTSAFELIEIKRNRSSKKGRQYAFKFQIDDETTATRTRNMVAFSAEDTPFEASFREFGEALFPKVFPGQENLKLVSLRRNIRDGSLVLTAVNGTGLAGSDSKSLPVHPGDVDASALTGLEGLVNLVQSLVNQRQPEPQLNLLEHPENE